MTSSTTLFKKCWCWIVIFWHRQSPLFDFSNYLKDLEFFNLTNKKVIGKIKDVSEGKINDEFVGLKWKMYSMKNIDDKESNTSKGVNIATVFNEFKRAFFNKKKSSIKLKESKKKKIINK